MHTPAVATRHYRANAKCKHRHSTAHSVHDLQAQRVWLCGECKSYTAHSFVQNIISNKWKIPCIYVHMLHGRWTVLMPFANGLRAARRWRRRRRRRQSEQIELICVCVCLRGHNGTSQSTWLHYELRFTRNGKFIWCTIYVCVHFARPIAPDAMYLTNGISMNVIMHLEHIMPRLPGDRRFYENTYIWLQMSVCCSVVKRAC